MIKQPQPHIMDKEKEYVLDCLNRHDVAQGNYVRLLEEKFAGYIGVKYASAVANGTIALHLALKTLDIKEGDEVIEQAITKKTKAIIPVHIYGNAADMHEICAIARKHGVFVIEDAAESHGATYDKKMTGSFSDISCFSFYSNKLMTTGEGGMCLTNSKELKDKMDMLRSQGKEFKHSMLGFNYRLSNINAAVGVGQFEHLPSVLTKKKHIADLYTLLIQKHELAKHLTMQQLEKKGSSVYWLVGILAKDGSIQDKLTKHLNAHGVETRSFFYPMHMHSFLPSHLVHQSHLSKSVTQDINERGIVLPNDSSMTDEEIEKVVLAIKSFFHS